MDRRTFLGGVGVLASAGILGHRAVGADDGLHVRVWLSERAAEYDGLGERVRGYLGAAMAPVRDDVRITVSERTVALPAEGGRRVLARRWPRIVVEGTVGGDLEPAAGVNLLVTDGDPTEQPAGMAHRHVAASTGARHIAEMDPARESSAVVPYSVAAASTQLLLHECGHALGLSHDHGHASVTDEGVVASPMVGSYLWLDEEHRREYLGDGNVCGTSYPPPTVEGDRHLGLRYSSCALGALLD